MKNFDPLVELRGGVESEEEKRKRTWGINPVEVRLREEARRERLLKRQGKIGEESYLREQKSLARGVRPKTPKEKDLDYQIKKIRGF